MKTVSNIGKNAIVIQAAIAFFSLCIASLGVVINHPLLIYVWYLALACIFSTIATSFIVGIGIILANFLKKKEIDNMTSTQIIITSDEYSE
jgi:ABC-type Na+ efflux pump permease subunit